MNVLWEIREGAPFSSLIEGVKFELILDGQAIVILVKNMGERDIPDSGMCEGTLVRESPTPTTIIMAIIIILRYSQL